MTKQDSSENQAKLVYLAIGSNLGNKKHNLDKAKLELKSYNIKILDVQTILGLSRGQIHLNQTLLIL